MRPQINRLACVHMRWTDIMRQSPIAVSDADEERGLTVITERFNLNLGEGVEVGRDFTFQWLFIDNAALRLCAALPVDATCANVPGCFFAVGPATMLPDRWTVTGQNAAGVCQYSTPDGVGLVHPEVCDERDNNRDGVVDNAPECVDEPVS